MPVKVRCRACEHQFSVSDAARGKSVKCKECGEPVKVPAGDGAGPKKAAKPQKSIEDDDFFSSINLDDAEHADKRICLKCTKEVDDEDIECPHCGVNLETGQMSERQKTKQKLKRRGPDPDEFYKLMWKDPWEYLKANRNLVFRLSVFWSVVASINVCSQFMVSYCEKIPLQVFYGAIVFISQMAMTGCFIQLTVAIVRAAMEQKTDIGRFNFDFFEDIAWGIKMMLWPLSLWGIVILPFAGVIAACILLSFLDASGTLFLVVWGGLGVASMVAMPAWPIALCHMSAKYTYKAYLPNEMLRITFKNLKQVSCWWMVSIVTAIPTLILATVGAVFASVILSFISAGILRILAYANVEILPERRGWMFYPILAGVAIFIIAIIMWFIGILLSINAVFIMRLTGIFCYYNQATLDMGDKRVAGEPAGFWIRYLGYLVDLIVVGIFEFIAFCFFLAIKLLMIEIGIEDLNVTIASVELFLIYPVIPIAYYVFSESGPGAGTLAKHALGIHVVTHEGKKPISRSQAITRFMTRFAGFFGLLMPLWDPEKRTMHDKASKTKVVWKPENY